MPLLWLSLAFLAGILLAASLTLGASIWLILAGLALVLGLVLRLLKIRGPQPLSHLLSPLPSLPYILIPFVLLLGAARYQSSLPAIQPGFIAFYNDLETPFIVEGVLVEPPDVRDTYVNLRMRVERIRPVDSLLFTPVDGTLLARVSPGGDWRYGDRIRLQGQLQTPPENEDFSYRDYLARQGVYSYMGQVSAKFIQRGQGNPLMAVIYALKGRALSTVYRLYPDPEASLLAGILLGVESGIPQPVQDAFKATGTSHIIAISGFNITIVAGLFSVIFLRLLGGRRRFLAAGLSAGMIAVYTLLVGADAAVVRAALMGGLSLFARQVGRRQDGLNSLAFVGGLMALLNPQVPWDVGFQLSFAATLGLVLYAEPLSNAFLNFASRYLPLASAQRLVGPVGEYFLFTLAAQLTTLPITVYHFSRLSLTSLIANPIVLPVQPAVMILSGLAVLLGLVFLPLGQILAYLAWPFVVFTIRAVELLGRIPGGVLNLGDVALFWVVLFYGVLLFWTFGGSRFRGIVSALKPSAALAALGLVTVVVWRAALSAPDGLLHLHLLNVGSGDAILIQTPTGRNLLIDGGPSTSALSDGLGRRLPLTNRQLDYLVVAAPNEGQVGALPRLLERFPPQNVLWAGPTHATRSARTLQEALNADQIRPTLAQTGQRLDLGQGAQIHFLAIGKRGAVLLLTWENFRVLLPIGMDFDAMESLQKDCDWAPVTALLLADNGYAPVNPPEWIARLRPQLLLLSVAADDRDGLPSSETLDAVQGYTLLRTDRNGWIHLSTDGEQMWVEVEKH